LEWSKELRGYILSSFFYGYVITQVPGGWLASRFGGKHVFGIGVFITLIATLLVPIAARTHAYLLIALRVIMGLGCVRIFYLHVTRARARLCVCVHATANIERKLE
jgi:MFS family permease